MDVAWRRGQLTPIAATERSPLLCSTSLAITAVEASGRRVRLRGVVAASLADTRIAIIRAGREVARPQVDAMGNWSVAVRRPTGVKAADVAYVATAGSARSEPVSLAQPLRIVRVRDAGGGRVRIQATLEGAKTARRATLERRTACGRKGVPAALLPRLRSIARI